MTKEQQEKIIQLKYELSEKTNETSKLILSIDQLKKELNDIRMNSLNNNDSSNSNGISNSEYNKLLTDIKFIITKSRIICNTLKTFLKERENSIAKKMELINDMIVMKKSMDKNDIKELSNILKENGDIFIFLEAFPINEKNAITLKNAVNKEISQKMDKLDKYRENLSSLQQLIDLSTQIDEDVFNLDLKYSATNS